MLETHACLFDKKAKEDANWGPKSQQCHVFLFNEPCPDAEE
jgi:hypothetical protein